MPLLVPLFRLLLCAGLVLDGSGIARMAGNGVPSSTHRASANTVIRPSPVAAPDCHSPIARGADMAALTQKIPAAWHRHGATTPAEDTKTSGSMDDCCRNDRCDHPCHLHASPFILFDMPAPIFEFRHGGEIRLTSLVQEAPFPHRRMRPPID